MTDPPAVPAADATAAGERRTLDAFLDGYRDAVVRKTTGLSDADGRRHLVASATTVSGLIKHLRWVEYGWRSEEHTSELQSRGHLVCRLLLEKKKEQHQDLLST